MSVCAKASYHLPNNLPVFSRSTRRWDCSATKLGATLGVDPGGRLFGVSSTREANVCELSTEITVVALVDDEGILRDRLGVNFVGVQEIDELGLGRSSFGGWYETEVVCRSTRGNLIC